MDEQTAASFAEAMGHSQLLPLWVLALLIPVVLPVCSYLGYWTGRAKRQKVLSLGNTVKPWASEDTSNAVMALLGLLLAFTFSFALSRAEDRRNTQVEEIAAIGTAFLQADLVAEPGRTDLRQAIATYAETRMTNGDAFLTEEAMTTFMSETVRAQGQLWPMAMAATGGDTPAPIRTMIAKGITDVLDAHTRRFSAAVQYIPLFAKVMIFVVACTALVLTSNSSAMNGNEFTWRSVLLAMLLSVVMIVVLDFERPREGFVQLDNSQFRLLIAELNGMLDAG